MDDDFASLPADDEQRVLAEQALILADGARILRGIQRLLAADVVEADRWDEGSLVFFRRGMLAAETLLSLIGLNARMGTLFDDDWPADELSEQLRNVCHPQRDGKGMLCALRDAVDAVSDAYERVRERVSAVAGLPEFRPEELALDDLTIRRLLEG